MPSEPKPQPDHRAPESDTLLIEDPSLRPGFVQLPKQVLYARNLSRDAKLLYAVLLGYAWQAGRCFPGYRRLCHDLGASENMVRKYLRELEQANLLRQKRRGLGRTNVYLLRDLRSAVLEVQELWEAGDQAGTAVSAVLGPQEWQVLEPQDPPDQPRPAKTAGQEPVECEGQEPWENAAAKPVETADKVERVEEDTEEREADAIEILESALAPSEAEHLSILRRVVTDICRELGDEAHEAANATRAINLWRRSGLSRYDFITLAYRARKQTRLYQGKQPPGKRIAAKGAYFFAVLENLVGPSGTGGAARDPPQLPCAHRTTGEDVPHAGGETP